MLIECEDSENELGEEILLKPKETIGENLPELSLHAMDGSVSPKTIRLLGQVNMKPVNVLLDTVLLTISLTQKLYRGQDS